MSPTRFPKMNSKQALPATTPQPLDAIALSAYLTRGKMRAVTFVNYQPSFATGRPFRQTACFTNEDLDFATPDDVFRFLVEKFPDAKESSPYSIKRIGVAPCETSGVILPLSAILATDRHPGFNNSTCWFIFCDKAIGSAVNSFGAGRPEAEVNIQELQRQIVGLRRDVEQLKLANTNSKRISSKDLADIKNNSQSYVEMICSSYKANFDAKFAQLERDLKESVESKPEWTATPVSGLALGSASARSTDACALSFKLAAAAAYPMTDGSGMARVVGKVPAQVGAMLLALDKLPDVRNVDGTAATICNTGSGLEVVARIKFSQWSNEWLCSWADDAKAACESASSSVAPAYRAPSSRAVPSSSSTGSFKAATYRAPVSAPLSKTSPTNPPRAYPAPSVAPLSETFHSRPRDVSPTPRVGCFKDVPPGLSGAQEEIPWIVKVDTPAKPDVPPVSDSDAFVCDYCLIPIVQSRFHCQSCVDFDVCKFCYPSRAKSHAQKHKFIQLNVVDDGSDDRDSRESSNEASSSSIRFPILGSMTSSGTVRAEEVTTAQDKPTRSVRSVRSASTHSTRSQSRSSFADVDIDLLSDLDSYEHVASDVCDYSDFEEHF